MSILPKDMLSTATTRLPIDGLPYKVQNIITTYAKALNCPTEFVTGAAMAAAAQAAGNRFVWSNGQYTCYPQFYIALLGDSTANKTTSIEKMMRPLEDRDRESFDQWIQATKDKKSDEKARTPYRIGILQDYTLESYQDALKYNPNGVTAYADEILSFFGNLNKYRAGADEKFYLSAFANYSDYKKTRRGRGIELIPSPIVRIVGGIQPDVLSVTFAGSPMLSDGMLPRFLWYAVPEDFHFDETATLIDTKQAETDWSNIINNLFRHQGIVRLIFDQGALNVYNEYKIEHAKAKNRKTLYGYEASVCGKLEIYAIMWAMTSRILRYVSEDSETGDTLTILEYDMQHSLRCMEYFQHTAMMVYDTITDTSPNLRPRDCILGLKDIIRNQSQFAESIGYSQQYVSKVLKGK